MTIMNMMTGISKARPLLSPALVATLALAISCGGGDQGTGQGTEVIRIDGSSTVYPITEAVAEEFQRANPAMRVTVGISGTGGGLQKFCRGEIDIADASRPIRESEREVCASAGIEYIELPVAYDGITVVVHKENTWATEMTVDELRRLWEPAAQGTIMRWNQIRTGWPDEEIHLFGAGVDSGTFDYFTEAIVGTEDASRGDFTSSEDDNVIVQGVSGDAYALGFFGFAYYEENQDRLKAVAIDDGDESQGAGAIAPSPLSIRDGSYRPLSRPVFIYPKVASLERPEVLSFVEFFLTQGRPLVREVGYISLTDREYDLVMARFADRRTGSMYASRSSQARVSLEDLLSQ